MSVSTLLGMLRWSNGRTRTQCRCSICPTMRAAPDRAGIDTHAVRIFTVQGRE